MIVDGGSGTILVTICNTFEGISKLDEYLLLIGNLLATSNIDFLRRHARRVRVVKHVSIVFLEPIVGFLILNRHVTLLNNDDKDIHDHAITVRHYVLTQ